MGPTLPPPVLPTRGKPGWTTSEFWAALFTHAIAATLGLLALFGVGVSGDAAQSAVPAAAALASAIAAAVYGHGRANVKTARLSADARATDAVNTSPGPDIGTTPPQVETPSQVEDNPPQASPPPAESPPSLPQSFDDPRLATGAAQTVPAVPVPPLSPIAPTIATP